MGRMSQESHSDQYVSSCIEYLHCTGCPSDVITWFLTKSEQVEWVKSFCTVGNKIMIIVDKTKVASEIGYFLHCESPAQTESIQEVVGGQQLGYDVQERRVPCS